MWKVHYWYLQYCFFLWKLLRTRGPLLQVRGLRPIRACVSLLVLSIAAAGFVIRACVSLLVLTVAAVGFTITACLSLFM